MPLLGFLYIYFPINTKNVCIVVILLSCHCCIHIVSYIDVMYAKTACADPERFARGGPTFFYKGKEDPNSIKYGPLSTRQRNAIQMEFHWRADDGPTLNAGLAAL